MIYPALTPLWYNLPSWYARSQGIRRQVRSIHRRGGKDVHDFSITVQDAIEYGGVHYYLFPTRVWAEEVIFKEQFEINGEMREFWQWAIPKELNPIKKEKDSCVILPHNGARIQLGGTDDLTFVGKGGKSYTMSEFSLHKDSVTGFIAPILRQGKASFRANGTLRGKENQLYRMLELNKDNPEWFAQWLRPKDTKCYCWVGDGYEINPELLGRVGKPSPNGGLIFNVQDDIDSGMISESLARQEYLNEAETPAFGSYFSSELSVCEGEGRMRGVFDPNALVYTFWDLGGANGENDKTAITFAQMDRNDGRVVVIDYYENTGKLRGHYFEILNSRGYRYGGHYVPHDAKKSNVWTGEDMIDTARSLFGVDMRRVPKTNSVKNDIEFGRRDFRNVHFVAGYTDRLLDHLKNYHESETTGKPCHKNNCSLCHGASHGADSFRTMYVARQLELVEPYLRPSIDIKRRYSIADDYVIC